MKLLGGECEISDNGVFSELTDSGRSSLKLILKSGLKDKKFLVPDYLCKIIIDILKEFDVRYSFYNVNEDLSVDEKSLKRQKFDALYVINYFGQKNSLPNQLKRDDLIVIEDDVFSPMLPGPGNSRRWIGFNSLRKVTYLADGSLIQSTQKLIPDLIDGQEAGFSKVKYEAKRIKYEYLHRQKNSEQKYLQIFQRAEAMLDRQRSIHSISKKSLFNLFGFYSNLEQEQAVRQANYQVLDRFLQDYKIAIKPRYFSFYVLALDRRDELREFLFSHKIFLPVHWPKIKGLSNPLYDRVLSIPLDSRYTEKDMKRTAQLILGFMKRKR